MLRRILDLLSRPRWQLALLLVGAAGVHAWLTATAIGDPYLSMPIGDEEYFHAWASAIASGTLASPTAFVTGPLFAYWLGALYSVFGDSVSTVLVANAVLGVATVALVWGTAYRVAGPRAAAIAGVLVAVCRAPLFYEGAPDKTALVLFLSALALFAIAWAEDHPSWRRSFLAGLAAGAAALAHPLLLVLVPVVAVHSALLHGVRTSIRTTAPYAGAALLAISPATIHNWVVSGDPVLISANSGMTLYIGNHRANATGLYEPPPFSGPYMDAEVSGFWREAERRTGRSLRAAEVSSFWTREALREMSGDPRLSLTRFLRRLRWTVNSEETTDSRTYEFYTERLPVLRFAPWGFGFIAVLGLVGAALAIRERRLRVLVGFSVVYAVVLSAYIVYGRYRLPLIVPFAILAGSLPATLGVLLRERRTRSLAGGTVFAVVAAGLVFGQVLPKTTSFFLDYNHLGYRYLKAGRTAEALAEFEKAVTVRPGNSPDVVPVALQLAWFFAARGDGARAIRLLETVGRARPGEPAIAETLSELRARGGAPGAQR
jgi:4-amino-4-deoxy-L-arabinose transferase-like glycosyltransferase